MVGGMLAAAFAAAATAAAAGVATVFSKSHSLPMSCIVCLGLHIYHYWDL